eukprot:96757-Prorocentrum_minimum.AAC.1
MASRGGQEGGRREAGGKPEGGLEGIRRGVWRGPGVPCGPRVKRRNQGCNRSRLVKTLCGPLP